MINKLILTNFKKHENLVIEFGPGLVALKGANEAGKSTIYHAITYAMFGSRALPLTLAETVTYNQPDSSLKVILEFTFGGALYHIQRSKSGAILTAGAVTANGQSEVTKYVENLFGVNADTAAKLMIASQNSLRGALEGNGAVPLIEKLSNLELIDELINKIQEQLPCGSTKALAASIEELQTVTIPVNNLETYQPEILKARGSLGGLMEAGEALKTQLANIDVAKYSDVLRANDRQNQTIDALNKELITVTDRLKAPLKPFTGDIDLLRDKERDQKNFGVKLKAYELFSRRVIPGTIFEGNLTEATAGALRLLEKEKELLQAVKVEMIRNKTLRINEDTCSLCGKLLQDVPEVVAKNSKVDAQELELKARQVLIQGRITLVTTRLAVLTDLQAQVDKINLVYAQISSYVTKSETTPSELFWVGEVPKNPDTLNYTVLIAEAEAAKALATKEQATHEALNARKRDIEENLRSNCNTVYDVVEAQQKLDEVARLKEELNVLVAKKHHAEMLLQAVEHRLQLATFEYTTNLEAYKKAQESIKKLKYDVQTYDKHNALIKKLREARPIIAARLWGLVLASVSNYFSQIRGFPSRVTRVDDRFLVDGKPVVGGVSGSTLDSLGLAMRMALGKTFLPSVDFLLLDEPAAGMDEERESAMLGLLASAGFTQTIVVTHSALADSFASSVIQL